jgi:hypothetical protein
MAAMLGVGLVLLFAAFTRHAWEDFYITFRSSAHLTRGDGLVYQPGERVHSFTSPLGTLLPALGALGGDGDPAPRALWIFRLFSAVALGGAAALLVRGARNAGVSAAAIAVACGLLLLDAKIIDFSGNGMESAWMVLFTLLTWHALAGRAPAWQLAVGYAGLQWTRPDGFILCLALTAAWLAFGREPGAGSRSEELRRVMGAVALGALLYLPWLLGAWLYFGSPVPHTILAKSGLEVHDSRLLALLLYPWRLLFGSVALHDLFMPSYFFLGGWPAFLPWLARVLAVPAALAWCLPGIRPGGRVASAALFLGGFYLEMIPRSPWYYPAWQALAVVSWAFLLGAAWPQSGPARPRPWLAATARITAAILLAFQAGLLASTAWQMRMQQRIIEDGHRRVVGEWLKSHAQAGDRVYLEPLGYIGYFSGLKMLDFPGLASPEVVATRRAGHRGHAEIIAALHPEWLVLRPDQVESILTTAPGLLGGEYRLAATFDARPAVNAVAVLPGRGYLQFDAVYQVFRLGGAGRPSP